MKFLHIDTEGKKLLSKQNWKEPTFTINNDCFRHSFNCFDNFLYLSAVKDNGKSHWQEVCPNDWKSGTHYYFDIALEEKKIYIISNDNIYHFFKTYGIYEQVINHSEYNKECKNRQQLIEDSEVLLDLLNKKNFNYKSVIIDDKKRTSVKVINKSVTIPKKGITEIFLIDIARTIQRNLYMIDFLSRKISSLKYNELKNINYHKLKNDGYNGLYYTQELFENKLILPESENVIREYIKWMLSDTLIVWSWIFDDNLSLN
jgi:hypothetical protein